MGIDYEEKNRLNRVLAELFEKPNLLGHSEEVSENSVAQVDDLDCHVIDNQGFEQRHLTEDVADVCDGGALRHEVRQSRSLVRQIERRNLPTAKFIKIDQQAREQRLSNVPVRRAD